MARHTKTKFAALAFSFVAALGVIAISPAAGSDAGKTVQLRGVAECC